jgi:hypothetical protein
MWVRLLVRFPHAFQGEMRVDLSGGETGVTEKLLHCAKLRPAIQEVGGESVTEEMRVHAADAGPARPRGDDALDAPSAQPSSRSAPRKQGSLIRPGLDCPVFQVGMNRGNAGSAEGDDSLFSAFAVDADQSRIEIQVVHIG